MAGDVPAVTAAIRLLECLREYWPGGRTAGSLAQELGINRSTCYHLLHTLRHWEWVEQAGRRWTVGPALTRFGTYGAAASPALQEALQEELESLARELPFVVAFAVQRSRDGSFVILAKAEVARLVRLTVEIGATFPPHVPSLRRVFDAWPGGAWPSPSSGRDPAEALDAVRRRGFAVSLGEYEPEYGAIAAPVFDAGRSVRWGVCVFAFSSQLEAASVADVANDVIRTARRLSERTGGVWPVEAAGV
jgi:DNA-binding IclR family transcriptional regulator